MSGQKLIRVFNAGALLLILLAAYAGKSLHTHPDEYYRYLTENDANTTSPALVDDCAICHFHFFSYIHSTDWVLDSEFRLLETFFRPECYDPAIVAISGSQLPCAACNRVDKFVPEPFVSGTIRPHVPSGAAKHRFHRVFSLIGRITGRCPCLAKTDPFYILKHRIILCIHLGA